MIKKLSLCALSVLAALPIGTVAQAADGDMQLQQVLMLSRHNLRAPLADNGSVLAQATKKAGRSGMCRAESSPRKVACWKSIWAAIRASGWLNRD